MKDFKIGAIVTAILVLGLLTGCGDQKGASKQPSNEGSTSIKQPQESSPEMKENKRDEPPVLLPSIPKEQIPDGIANNVREKIQMLYTTTIGQFGALDILGGMGERAAPAVPFIVSLLPSEAGLAVRSGSGFRFYDGQGKESDMMNMSKRRVSIGRKAVETLVKIGKPSVDALISCLDTENQNEGQRPYP